MTIRTYNKDNFDNERAGRDSSLVLPLPVLDDPLQFWLYHPKENFLVDLRVFAEGFTEGSNKKKNSYFFTGRAQLIRQMLPFIKSALAGRTKYTMRNGIKAIRAWWRLFDEVELAGGEEGVLTRVEDIRDISVLHLDVARRSGMTSDNFTWFLAIVNAALKELGIPVLYWDAFGRPSINRNLPSETQITKLRIALKQAWEAVRRHFMLSDSVRVDGYMPACVDEAEMLAHWKYFSEKQREHGVALPSSQQLCGEIDVRRFYRVTGVSLLSLRAAVYPTLWDADTAFHMCLANTGWNPGVLSDLDARSSELFLYDHPYDKSRYVLVGTKARAGGKDQPVIGLWKTPWGPGPIIRFWLQRVKPLRDQLEAMLIYEREKYNEMSRAGVQGVELARQHSIVQSVEQGCRCIWLYVGKMGQIEWLRPNEPAMHGLNCGQVAFLDLLVCRINQVRVTNGEVPIERVRPSDFRDIFSLYVWRQSGGNIFVLMRLLNHSSLRVTQDYVDNNILNAERDAQISRFLENLFRELGEGRLDITILAHLQRYGVVTPEMEVRLESFRALQRSRLGIACKNPLNPPPNVQSDARIGRWCTVQRCLLCRSNSIILPESLSGICMRVEELIVIQKSVSAEVWLNSDFPQELSNGLSALSLFEADQVKSLRNHWAHEVYSGSHRVPGLRIIEESRDCE
jgi:hypothetical protein